MVEQGRMINQTNYQWEELFIKHLPALNHPHNHKTKYKYMFTAWPHSLKFTKYIYKYKNKRWNFSRFILYHLYSHLFQIQKLDYFQF